MQRKLDYKWVVLLLVSIAYFLAQGTRLIYSAVLPQIKADFAASGVTDAQLGLISSAFTLVFGIAIPFAGLIADFFNRKRVLVLGSFMFAIGQSLMPPCNTSLISQYHNETRGTAFSIYQPEGYSSVGV